MFAYLLQHKRQALVIWSVFVMAFGVFASAGAQSLDLDVTPIFTSINTYLPIFMPIIAIGGGISIAMLLGSYVVKLIIGAFKGGT